MRLEVTEAVFGHISGTYSGIVGVYQRHRFGAEKSQTLKAWAEHVRRVVEGREAVVVPFVRR